MEIVSSLVIIVRKLLEFASVRSRRIKSDNRKREFDDINDNPEKSQSDMFGESSGRVSINRDKSKD